MSNAEDLSQEAARLLKGIPDGPWYVEDARLGRDDEARVYDRRSYGVCKPTPNKLAYRRPIAEFIAAAPRLVRGLLAEREQMRAALAQVVEEMRDEAALCQRLTGYEPPGLVKWADRLAALNGDKA